MLNGVVFDMDGVLFDTERLYREAWYDVGTRWSLEDIDSSVKLSIGLNWKDTSLKLLDKFGLDFAVQDFRDELNAYVTGSIAAHGIPIKPGAPSLLQWLNNLGIPVGLATSSSYKSAESHLRDARLLDYFQVIITGDMISKGKPDPEIYKTACSRLGILSENCFAIEDSPNGIKSAHGAGLKVIMVPDLIQPTPEIQPLLYSIHTSLRDVQAFFQTLAHSH